MGWGWRWARGGVGCLSEMADALWEGHTQLKTGVSTDRNTGRHTKVKTVAYIRQFHSVHLVDINIINVKKTAV